MSWVAIRDGILSSIADAIREKTGKTSTILPGEMAAEIESIETGGGGGGVSIDDIAAATDNQVLGDTVTITARTLAKYGLMGRAYKNVNISTATIIPNYFFAESSVVNVTGDYNTLQDYAFQNCVDLESVDLDEVTVLGYNVFEGCESLTEVTLPKLSNCGGTPFKSCTGIKKVDLSKNHESFSNTVALVAGMTNLEEFIGPHITSLRNSCFYNFSKLKSVICGGTIATRAFSNCSALKTVSILNSTSINASAFNQCPAVTDVYVDFAAGDVSGAPWGATNATIHYNTVFDDAGNIVT